MYSGVCVKATSVIGESYVREMESITALFSTKSDIVQETC